ncbi:MAG: hypothetical protein CMB80_18110 [Flammeovirgaceae bacterium]|nr:hypothetical protein [Flammeovirgaceae bacterium]MBE61816.1 hypothetical protein [Flammeovirgaceae bacterium]MBR06752.1 hypothetical protein [Rickettsiales bacterium]|tara:strand:- start:80 stop:577 length:498 start_codon:yes stop_codon:yes gene_type:complete
MKIALIINDYHKERASLKVGLELEERLTALGIENDMLDLQDDYLIDISLYDSIILIAENQGPLISFELYSIILNNRSEWQNKLILPIITTEEAILGESAFQQIRMILKSLGANIITEQTIFTKLHNKFDQLMNLKDQELNFVIDRLILLVLSEGKPSPSRMRIIA